MRILVILPSNLGAGAAKRIQSQVKTGCPENTGLDVTLFIDNPGDGTPPPGPDGAQTRHREGLRRIIGPGGFRKIAFRHAIDQSYDAAVTFDGDADLVPSVLPSLSALFQENPDVDCILGDFSGPRSLLRRQWRKALGALQNALARASIRNWHASCRAYRVRALEKIAFELNTPDAHFDTEILLQLLDRGAVIRETAFPMPSPATRRFPSWRRARGSLKAALRYRLQQVNLFYDFRFHPEEILPKNDRLPGPAYAEKFSSQSPHATVCSRDDLVPPGSRVLDIGCSFGYVADRLAREKNCRVTGIDRLPPEAIPYRGFEYHSIDLENDFTALDRILAEGNFDVILMLDVIEHLAKPELFLLHLYQRKYAKTPVFILSTGNVAFIVIRLMLMLGYFNYGNKGILDVTHKRLFSVRTFQNMLDQTGFVTHQRIGFPLPFRELGWPPALCQKLEKINAFLIRCRMTLFSYQVMVRATPLAPPAQTLAAYLQPSKTAGPKNS